MEISETLPHHFISKESEEEDIQNNDFNSYLKKTLQNLENLRSVKSDLNENANNYIREMETNRSNKFYNDENNSKLIEEFTNEENSSKNYNFYSQNKFNTNNQSQNNNFNSYSQENNIDTRNNKNQIISTDSKQKLINEDNNYNSALKFSALDYCLDVCLKALNLDDFTPFFFNSKATFRDFLLLNYNDLQHIGFNTYQTNRICLFIKKFLQFGKNYDLNELLLFFDYYPNIVNKSLIHNSMTESKNQLLTANFNTEANLKKDVKELKEVKSNKSLVKENNINQFNNSSMNSVRSDYKSMLNEKDLQTKSLTSLNKDFNYLKDNNDYYKNFSEKNIKESNDDYKLNSDREYNNNFYSKYDRNNVNKDIQINHSKNSNRYNEYENIDNIDGYEYNDSEVDEIKNVLRKNSEKKYGSSFENKHKELRADDRYVEKRIYENSQFSNENNIDKNNYENEDKNTLKKTSKSFNTNSSRLNKILKDKSNIDKKVDSFLNNLNSAKHGILAKVDCILHKNKSGYNYYS